MKHFYLEIKDSLTDTTEIVPVSEEIYREFVRPKWRESKKRKRSHHCRLQNGKRCYGDCNTCKYAPAESFSFEKILEEGIPVDELNKGVMLPHTDGDILDKILHDHLITEMLKLIDKLTGEERIIIEDYLEKVAEAETAKKIGCCQKTVNNKKQKILKMMREALTKNSF